MVIYTREDASKNTAHQIGKVTCVLHQYQRESTRYLIFPGHTQSGAFIGLLSILRPYIF